MFSTSSFRNLGREVVSGARAFHGHARPPPGRAPPNASLTQTTGARVIQATRTLFTRIAANLAAPGLGHPAAVGRAAGLSTRVNATVRPPTIESRLSLPARNALHGLQRGPFLPRVTPASKNITHVGLGTARNFSTARPIFEHLVQNVPVAARAICDADLDVEKRKMKAKNSMAMKKSSKVRKTSRRLAKPTKATKAKKAVKELDAYFPEVESVSDAPSVGTTTFLFIPLAPTPTSRYPLSASGIEGGHIRFIDKRDVRDIVTTHRKHQLRVSSLFARLDTDNVWDRGAKISAHGDASGLCTLLRVEFNGWSEADVSRVLGEAGKSWCDIVEVKDEADDKMSKSGDPSPASSTRSTSPLTAAFDPAASVVLPTLDFSASFLASQASPPAFASSSLPPSPPSSCPGSGYASPLSGFSSLSPRLSEFGDVEMDMDWVDANADGHSPFSASPEWTEMGLGSPPGGSVMGLSATFMEQSETQMGGLELREVGH